MGSGCLPCEFFWPAQKKQFWGYPQTNQFKFLVPESSPILGSFWPFWAVLEAVWVIFALSGPSRPPLPNPFLFCFFCRNKKKVSGPVHSMPNTEDLPSQQVQFKIWASFPRDIHTGRLSPTFSCPGLSSALGKRGVRVRRHDGSREGNDCPLFVACFEFSVPAYKVPFSSDAMWHRLQKHKIGQWLSG